MTADKIKKTLGLKCKACMDPEVFLEEEDGDGELCSTCLAEVYHMNRELYERIEDEAYQELQELAAEKPA